MLIILINSILIKLIISHSFNGSITGELIKVLDEISSNPAELVIQNSYDIENSGGHLQGIQPYHHHGEDYLFWSGSSSKYGYLATAKQKEIKRLHILEHKPLKHAGGFQICGNWLAVGVEDNEARDFSRIHIYQLEDPLARELKLKGTIERNGEWERATAGAVAIYEYYDSILLLAGDWSNRHIDFYRGTINAESQQIEFIKTGEIEMANYPKTDWIDSTPWPYQNINLINYQGKLFLFGFSAGENDVNVMDVYSLDNEFKPIPSLTKVYSRTFNKTKQTRFGWGAGITVSEENGATIYMCGQNIKDQTVVNVLSSKK